MYLLFDECIARSLVKTAEALGHAAQRSVDIAELGRGASDRRIFHFASRFGARIVTANRGDFVELAIEAGRHPGLIFVPSMPTGSLTTLFKAMLLKADYAFETGENLVVELDAAGSITALPIP